jgi:hypothetical protein
MRTQAMSLAQVCRTDYERLCHDVQAGDGRRRDAEKVARAIRRPMSRRFADVKRS